MFHLDVVLGTKEKRRKKEEKTLAQSDQSIDCSSLSPCEGNAKMSSDRIGTTSCC
jgi:hypothetical protein